MGVRTPSIELKSRLGTGEVGYLVAGIKNVLDARVGDTITSAKEREREHETTTIRTLIPKRRNKGARLREEL